MIRILLACEGGSGLGHVDSLKMFARALGPAFAFDGVHFDDAALAALAEVCNDSFRGPAFMPSASRADRGVPLEQWTWAHFLERCGLADIRVLAPSLNWWRSTLQLRRIDLVVCDYAPRALIAARMLGIPAVLTGTAYSVPPDGLKRFPVLLDQSPGTSANEEAMTARLNAFCAVRGLPALRALPDVFNCDVKLPQGIPAFDPYQGLRTEPLLPRPAGFSRLMAGHGDEVLVYLSNIAADPGYMLDSLHGIGAPVRVFAPWLEPAKAAALRAQGIAVEDQLIHPDAIARRTRLMVLYGQPGTTVLGLASGIPQVALPQHFEQTIHARLAARLGGVRVVARDGLDQDGFVAAIRAAYADETLFSAAQRSAAAVRRELDVNVDEMIREALRPALVGVIKRRGLA